MFDIIENRRELVKKIDSIATRGKSLRADLVTAAASCWQHAADYGDFTLASRLVNRSPKSMQSDLRRYFQTFAPMIWSKKEQQFRKVKKGGTFDPAALETAFDAELEPKAKAKPAYDTAKELARIIAELNTHADRALENDDTALFDLVIAMAESVAPVLAAVRHADKVEAATRDAA